MSDFIGCSFRKYKIAPLEMPFLKIEDKKFSYEMLQHRPLLYVGIKRSYSDVEQFAFSVPALMTFYKMVEENLSECPELFYFDLELYYSEIFELNRFFSFTPIEWAIHLNKMDAFKLFIKKTFNSSFSKSRIKLIGTLLMAMAIQYNNLEAAEILFNYALIDYSGKGLLSIAVQHRANPEFFNFLLGKCDLIHEINHSSDDNSYPKPLISCIKFNNFNAAVILLENGATFDRGHLEQRDESVLATIMKKKRERLLRHILEKIPLLCNYKDSEGNNLLHYTVLYSIDPKAMDLILETCPELSIDSQNYNRINPLASVLNKDNSENADGIALKLISLGADISIQSNEFVSPLDLVIKHKHYDIFTFILDHSPVNIRSNGILENLVRSVSKNSLWSWLDRLLKAHPDINTDWIDFSNIKFDDLLSEFAYLTFELALKKNIPLHLPSDFLNQIVQSSSKEFLSIARDNGFDVDGVDISNLNRVELTNENDLV